jgi:hypothetical protein
LFDPVEESVFVHHEAKGSSSRARTDPQVLRLSSRRHAECVSTAL